jgi:hypothetical protein
VTCPSCGADNTADARRCASCGAELAPGTSPTEPVVTPSHTPGTEPVAVVAPTEPLGPSPTPPPGPSQPFASQPGVGRPSFGTGWGIALRWGGGAFAAVLILGLVIGVAVGIRSEADLSVPDMLRLGAVYVSLFHHTPVVVELAGRRGVPSEVSPLGAVGGGVEIGLALGLATALGAFLLFRGGRAVAARAGGSPLARGLHGLKVAPLYAVLSLVVASLASFRVDVAGNPVLSGTIGIHPSLVGAVIWPLAIAAVAGFAGGLTSIQPETAVTVWSRRVVAAVGGAWRMFAAAIVLAFVGFLVVAALHPDATRAYFRGIAEAGPRDGTVLLSHHVLLLPNQSMWILVPAMGGCDTLTYEVQGFRGSTDFLCYWRFPGTGADDDGSLSVFGLRPSGGGFGTAPPAYFLFLLVPLLATILGGRWAGTRSGAEDRAGAVTAGTMAGAGFALLVAAGIILARLTLSLSASTGPIGFVGSGGATVGPALLAGTGLALVWGAMGGAAGGWLAARRGPQKPNEPGREPGSSEEDQVVRP